MPDPESNMGGRDSTPDVAGPPYRHTFALPPILDCPRCEGWGYLDDDMTVTCEHCGGRGELPAAVTPSFTITEIDHA